ncbi:hypothetical protein L0Y59_03700 [Candidatus Uhrbacteria bacterium]|nr:hypothetical protein [Candidatus Uhrbacteria bacterium]
MDDNHRLRPSRRDEHGPLWCDEVVAANYLVCDEDCDVAPDDGEIRDEPEAICFRDSYFLGVDPDGDVGADPHGVVRRDGVWRQHESSIRRECLPVKDDGSAEVADYFDVGADFRLHIPQELPDAPPDVSDIEGEPDPDGTKKDVRTFPGPSFLDPYEEDEERERKTHDPAYRRRRLRLRREILEKRTREGEEAVEDARAVRASRILAHLASKQEADRRDLAETLDSLRFSRGTAIRVTNEPLSTTCAALRPAPSDPHDLQSVQNPDVQGGEWITSSSRPSRTDEAGRPSPSRDIRPLPRAPNGRSWTNGVRRGDATHASKPHTSSWRPSGNAWRSWRTNARRR